MIVHALIGSSGTGKSHHAPLFAHKNNISVIVDDGLLIHDNQVIAGVSAKRERTRYGAVKRAILKDPEHAEAIREQIRKINPSRILILGTSQKMAKRIAERLELPHPHNYTFINDLIPPENIEKALELRETKNQHVIPIPTFAIKKDFPGYLIAPLRSFYSRAAKDHKNLSLERTLIRPIYSSLGDFFINEEVIKQLTRYISDNLEGVHQTDKIDIYSDDSGVTLEVQITAIYGLNIKEILLNLQKEIKDNIEYLTGFYLAKVYTVARQLHIPEDKMPREINKLMPEREKQTLRLYKDGRKEKNEEEIPRVAQLKEQKQEKEDQEEVHRETRYARVIKRVN